MNKRILKLVLPNIITNITVPLLGMVDLAIVGHIGDEIFIGAIAIGTMIFNMIYWNFGFLRMGTSGFTAQAYGAEDMDEAAKILSRALFIAICFSLLLIIFQTPILKFAFLLITDTSKTKDLITQYFAIRIWAAPATLGIYAIKGWLIGMQNSKQPMWMAIIINVVNILCSFLLAVVYKMGIKGVALGTVIAQYSGLTACILILLFKYKHILVKIDIRKIFDKKELLRFFKLNYDIFLRTLCLIAVFTFIPAEGSKYSDMVLAVNTLLMQFFTLFSYILDGFAYAGEALVGRYIGAKDKKSLTLVIKLLFMWGIVLSIIFIICYASFGHEILWLFTDDNYIINAADEYYFWVLIIPIISFSAFLWDGIYIGAMATKYLRNSIFIATAIFFVLYYMLNTYLGNNALWMAFIAFLFFRGFMQFVYSKKAVFNQV